MKEKPNKKRDYEPLITASPFHRLSDLGRIPSLYAETSFDISV